MHIEPINTLGRVTLLETFAVSGRAGLEALVIESLDLSPTQATIEVTGWLMFNPEAHEWPSMAELAGPNPDGFHVRTPLTPQEEAQDAIPF
jgi:hypothetical protein